ncbi:MAG: hypothetical protein QXJ17_05375 [Nitrososphaeria archaeon]
MIENAWDFALYLTLGFLILLLMTPLNENLYKECIDTQGEIIAKAIEKTALHLKENMTIKLFIVHKFQRGAILETSEHKIMFHIGDNRTVIYDTQVLFYDSSIELKEQILISKSKGKISVQSI